jgi:UBA-like domain
MSSEADKIAQFQSITGAPEHIARSILESTNWDLEVPFPIKFR